ncbi:MAG: cytochrome c [Sulfurovaceae bacterium]
MMFVIGIVGVWPGEKLRESMRKPYVAGQYIYSNQIISRDVPGKGVKSEVEVVASKGLLGIDPWVPDRLRTITPENKLEVGEYLTKRACSNCHSLEKGGKYRSMVMLIETKLPGTDKETIKNYMHVIGTGAIPYMPKIALPDEEYDAMAEWIAAQVNN